MLTNIFEFLRYALFAAAIALTLMLYQAWTSEHVKPTTATQVTANAIINNANYVPSVTTSKSANNVVKATPVTASTHIIHVVNEVMDVEIDALGGNIVQVKLLKYPEDINSKTPYVLLNNSPDTQYIAQSGLLSTSGPDTSNGQALYSSEKDNYQFEPGQKELQVNLHWQDNKGLQVNKTFTFYPDNYEIDMAYQLNNKMSQAWEGNLYLQLLRKNAPPASTKGIVSLATYFGAAVYDTSQKHFQKINFKDMEKLNFSQTINGGWAAMIQHYFVSAWVPEINAPSQYFSRVTSDGLYTIGALGPKLVANPDTSIETHAKFYAGPSISDKLEKVAPGLPLTIDYGIFWIISGAIFWLMQKIYNVVGNWGWSIVLVTLLIKLMFYHLSAKSYRSMSMMKKLQPKINALKERYGDDKQKFTQETIALYRKEKVNPMSGCLPVLVQIPVFIGLYWVLIESVQLRQAPFILWIQDLSQKDPFYVLPVLMGISMFLQQRLNPPPPDPMQAKVMMFMPVIFTALFLNFPAGLMLYWFMNNALSFLQQWYVMKSIDGAKPVHSKK
jgi:YidC/Oxa1 family membrane protein insertase